MTIEADFFSLSSKDANNELQQFSQYKNKVVLVVNVASKCGFTPQYRGLESLYQKYEDQGFVILGFPCNQFGGQESGSMDEIKTFCSSKYDVTFPIMEKCEVNGDHVHPVWTWLKVQKSGFLGLTRIKWNFEKFLIGRDGHVINRWSSITTPKSLDQEIQQALSVPQ